MPDTISVISFVIPACLDLLKTMVNSVNKSLALSDAAFMAILLAACSEALVSKIKW